MNENDIQYPKFTPRNSQINTNSNERKSNPKNDDIENSNNMKFVEKENTLFNNPEEIKLSSDKEGQSSGQKCLCAKGFATDLYKHCFDGASDKLVTFLQLANTGVWIFDGRPTEGYGGLAQILVQNSMALLATSMYNISKSYATKQDIRWFKPIYNEMVKNIILLSGSFVALFVNKNLAIFGASHTQDLVQNKLGISPLAMSNLDASSYLLYSVLPALILITAYISSFYTLRKNQLAQGGEENNFANCSKRWLKFILPILCVAATSMGLVYTSKLFGSQRPIELSGINKSDMQMLNPSVFWQILNPGIQINTCYNSEGTNFPSTHGIAGGVVASAIWNLRNLTQTGYVKYSMMAVAALTIIWTASSRILSECNTPSATLTGEFMGVMLSSTLFNIIEWLLPAKSGEFAGESDFKLQEPLNRVVEENKSMSSRNEENEI